jgi:hypothetical protein
MAKILVNDNTSIGLVVEGNRPVALARLMGNRVVAQTPLPDSNNFVVKTVRGYEERTILGRRVFRVPLTVTRLLTVTE